VFPQRQPDSLSRSARLGRSATAGAVAGLLAEPGSRPRFLLQRARGISLNRQIHDKLHAEHARWGPSHPPSNPREQARKRHAQVMPQLNMPGLLGQSSRSRVPRAAMTPWRAPSRPVACCACCRPRALPPKAHLGGDVFGRVAGAACHVAGSGAARRPSDHPSAFSVHHAACVDNRASPGW